MKTFVFGDVHGRLDLLINLLHAAGITDTFGERLDGHHNTRLISVGDLGNFSEDTVTADYACYEYAAQQGIRVLWGNHDYAAVDPVNHAFRGYAPPMPLTRALFAHLRPAFATVAHGYLITHAGVHPGFIPYFGPEKDGAELVDLMYDYIVNRAPEQLINNIGQTRGGPCSMGGLLWRDADREKLAHFPQIFGHTKGYVRIFRGDDPMPSYCIDAGVRSGNLAGIWLPDRKIVAIGPDADVNVIGVPV